MVCLFTLQILNKIEMRLGCILLFALALYCSSYLLYMLGIIRASRAIHRQLIDSVLGTTLRFVGILHIVGCLTLGEVGSI